MAKGPKVDLKIGFNGAVPVGRGSRANIKKLAKTKPGEVTLGVTLLHATYDSPVLYWDEVTDPIAGKIEMTVTKIDLQVRMSCRTLIDKTIPGGTPCYKHVAAHERQHVKHFKASAVSRRGVLKRNIEKNIAPLFAKPLLVDESQASAMRALAYKRIKGGIGYVLDKHTKVMTKATNRKLHTKAERRRTDTVCALYT